MKAIIFIFILTTTFTFAAIAQDAYSGASRTQAAVDRSTKSVTYTCSLHCQGCVDKIQKNLAYEKGVKDLAISLDEKTVTVKYRADKTDATTLKGALEKLGYTVEIKTE